MIILVVCLCLVVTLTSAANPATKKRVFYEPREYPVEETFDRREQLPWHVGIYLGLADSRWVHYGDGTVISSKVVITAAFTVTRLEGRKLVTRSPSAFQVAAGKYNRDFIVPDKHAQIRKIQFIYTPKTYIGSAGLYSNDIGFIVVTEAFEFNDFVKPVCLDLTPDFEAEQLFEGSVGTMASWGLHTRLPKAEEFPYVSRETCRKGVERNQLPYLTYDKYCAGSLIAEICGGNTGGGMYFYNATDKCHYLRGVMTLGGARCGTKGYVFLVRISAFPEMVRYFSKMKDFDLDDLNRQPFALEDRTLSQSPGTCYPPPSEKLTFTCLLQNDTIVPCDKPLFNGTKVSFKCKNPPYKEVASFPRQFVTCINGKWDSEIQDDFCELACGERIKPEMFKSENHYRTFPWHVGIYTKGYDVWYYVCGGTIISHKVIITAADCLVRKINDKKLSNISPKYLLTAAGRYEITLPELNLNLQDKELQIRKVQFAYAPKTYLDDVELSFHDIGFIVLTVSFDFNGFVMPVCLDFSSDLEAKQLVEGSIGLVFGLGSRKNIEEGPKIGKLPYVSSRTCRKELEPNLTSIYSYDKFCAGSIITQLEQCGGDLGGGIYFYNSENHRYYLRGVINTGGKDCEKKGFVLPTRISTFPEMVRYFAEMKEFDLNDFIRQTFLTDGQISTQSVGAGTCELPYSDKLIFTCRLETTTIPCNRPLPNGAKAFFKCVDPPYRDNKPFPHRFVTCNNGKWDSEIQDDFCNLVCGEKLKLENGKTDEEVIYKGGFPWHVAIYVTNGGSWNYRCSGTVISNKVIITTADCAIQLDGENFDSYLIAAGKYHSQSRSIDNYSQIRKVQYVYVPKTYTGLTGLYANDVGFMVVTVPFEFNAFVRPVCLDFSPEFEAEQMVEGSVGVFTGWGRGYDATDVPKVVELPFVSEETCRKGLESNLQAEYTYDKFCAGSLTKEGSVCSRDVGGGVYFRYPENNRYYLRGIINIGGKSCEVKGFALLTRISAFSETVKYFAEMKEFSRDDLNRQSFASGIPRDDKCEALTSDVVKIDCYDSDGFSIDCSRPLSEGTVARFRCDSLTHVKAYEPEYSEIVCEKSRWNKKIPTDFCTEKSAERALSNASLDVSEFSNGCYPPSSSKMVFTCTLQERKKLPCNKPLPNGAKVRFQCLDPTYKKVTPFPYSSVTCKNGKWDKELPEEICQAICGLAMSQQIQPQVAYGKSINYGEFPWHVAIYSKINDTWQYVCGGSIISRKSVITAAHCIAKVNRGERVRENASPDSILVAAGKYHRDINETDEHEQFRTVAYVYAPEMYLGLTRLYADDIGFLVLKKPFDFDAFVRPVCIDVGRDSFENEQLVEGAVGTVTGWGLQEDYELSDELKVAKMPYVSTKTCVNGIDRNLIGQISQDKFCAGNLTSDTTVCKGDSGGGIVFYYPFNNRYYLRGIVSLGGHFCEGKEYVLFTKISAFADMITYFVEVEQFDPNDLDVNSFNPDR